jgi:hypothetical protein
MEPWGIFFTFYKTTSLQHSPSAINMQITILINYFIYLFGIFVINTYNEEIIVYKHIHKDNTRYN